LLKRADARGSAYVICRIWRISLVWGSGSYWGQKVGQALEYPIRTNNIKVLDSYFNLMSKSIHIGRLRYV